MIYIHIYLPIFKHPFWMLAFHFSSGCSYAIQWQPQCVLLRRRNKLLFPAFHMIIWNLFRASICWVSHNICLSGFPPWLRSPGESPGQKPSFYGLPWWLRSPGEGKGYYSSILAWRIPMDCIVSGVTKNCTCLSS